MKYGIRMTGRKPNGQFYIDSVYILFDTLEEARKRLDRINQTVDYPPHIEYSIVAGENLTLHRMVDQSYFTRDD